MRLIKCEWSESGQSYRTGCAVVLNKEPSDVAQYKGIFLIPSLHFLVSVFLSALSHFCKWCVFGAGDCCQHDEYLSYLCLISSSAVWIVDTITTQWRNENDVLRCGCDRANSLCLFMFAWFIGQASHSVTLLMFVLFREIRHELPVRSSVPLSSGSEFSSSAGRPKKRRAGRPRTADGRDRDTDYASSGDELDDEDFFRWVCCWHQALWVYNCTVVLWTYFGFVFTVNSLPLLIMKREKITNTCLIKTIRSTRSCRQNWTRSTNVWLTWTESSMTCRRAALSSWYEQILQDSFSLLTVNNTRIQLLFKLAGRRYKK